SPRFALDLVERLAAAMEREQAEIAMVAAPETDSNGQRTVRTQPVFCLLQVNLLESLQEFTQGGGRKIDAWTALHRTVIVPFDGPDDDPLAFSNANTLAELKQLESS
ncbi:MAG: molybdenum cofactor guanylyltransferase MobA, partial [Hylemonella sp.]|nr:molybdenum cofactor guanylyltransferase MobA [Hylemonella sp.]